MSSRVKLSILIPTVTIREAEFARLRDILSTQVVKYGGRIEVLVYWNNFEHPIGEIRQRMLKEARGEYVVFIDDDDTVPDYFCKEIMPLLDGVDHIGYQVQFTRNGRVQKPVYHTIKSSGYYDDSTGFYRKVTPKDPIRRDIALQGSYDRSDYTIGLGEETTWMEDVTPLVKTEHYIDKIMYYYNQVEGSGVFARTEPAEGNFTPPTLPKYFRFMEWT